MNEDAGLGPRKDVKIEEHGAVIDAIVPIAQAGVAGAVGGAVNAVVSNHLGKSDPPPPPPPADGE